MTVISDCALLVIFMASVNACKIREAEHLLVVILGMTLNIAANYGGRWDIVQATQNIAVKLANGSLRPEQIDEALLAEHLSMADIPDVDLLIRTGGDHRISNFYFGKLHMLNCILPGALA